jgi:hypothetical protein
LGGGHRWGRGGDCEEGDGQRSMDGGGGDRVRGEVPSLVIEEVRAAGGGRRFDRKQNWRRAACQKEEEVSNARRSQEEQCRRTTLVAILF